MPNTTSVRAFELIGPAGTSRAAAALARGTCAAALALLAGLAAPVAAQESAMTGFSPEAASAQRTLERTIVERVDPATLDSFSYALTRETHVAGTPAQARTRDWVLETTRGFGLRSEAPAYRIYLPHATGVEFEMTAPERRSFTLHEAEVDADPTSGLDPYPWANGYTGRGTVEADVVYANYGLHEDYAALDSLGVSVEGRIVVARYGRSYRGVKAQLAEEHGAVGVILYSDPEDDGAGRGPVYPDGTWRPPTGVQRGSIMGGTGDPTTPGWASVEGARRVEPGSSPGVWVPSVPVVPVGYGIVEPVLATLGGPAAPDDWQGGLDFDYRIGPGPVRVRLSVEDDRDSEPYKTVWNTVAWLPGTDRPDEWVVVGGHRDAWGPGANDNVSGTAAVIAAAKALAGLAADGHRPRRTIAFATWDAEEWGLIGSTEWTEQFADELSTGAVAYLNMDVVAGGPNFGAGASPSLKRFVREVTRAVPAPDGRPIYDGWRERAGAGAACAASPVPDSGDVALGNLGGGSDFAGFYNHLGVPSTSWGFGGGWGQYHSQYDSYTWMSRFGDPGFEHHAAAAELGAVAALRLANAAVLPYDYAEFACEIGDAVDGLAESAADAGLDDVGLDALRRAFDEMRTAGAAFDAARTAYLAAAPDGDPSYAFAGGEEADEANAHLLRVERALTRDEGLDGRPWYRYLIFAADKRNGYATLILPGIAEAIRAGDVEATRAEAEDLARRIGRASAHLRRATTALRGDGT